MALRRSTSERCAMLLVTTGIFVVWSGIALAVNATTGLVDPFVQSTVLILAGLAFGLRAPLGAVLLSYVYLVLVAIGLSSLSYAVALQLKSEDAFAPLVNSVVVPLILLSGIMLPMTLGPGWLQGIARISPFRYIIDAMREAYAGRYWDAITVEGLCVAVGTAAVLLWLGSRVFVTENA